LIAKHKRFLLFVIPRHEREGTLELVQINEILLETGQQLPGLDNGVVGPHVERQSLHEEPATGVRGPNWIQTGLPTEQDSCLAKFLRDDLANTVNRTAEVASDLEDLSVPFLVIVEEHEKHVGGSFS